MASRTVFCLLLALFVAQCSADDVDIWSILKDPSTFIANLKEQFEAMEATVKNETEAFVEKIKSGFEDIEQKISDEIAKGEAAGQCISARQDNLTSLARQGEQDLVACASLISTDMEPIAASFATTATDIAELALECSSSGTNVLSIALCLIKNSNDVKTVIQDVSNVTSMIPSTYTSVKADIESCQQELSAETEELMSLVEECLDQ
ncbi:hypothetical protein L9F63_005926 [Diploptera punctata]|uniref:Uncharacterized protein n=1 Tax=Diploptera punctata TaxID=6984 RepID=A0AAD7ZCP7_DIPPU|nr:hypothetical protein L9F63_005926 [Diploptera punctata]